MSIRTRRALVRVCIAVLFASLPAEALVPAYRHHSAGDGLPACIFGVLGVTGGLLYLRSTRGQS